MSLYTKGCVAVLLRAPTVLDPAKLHFHSFWQKVRGSQFLANVPHARRLLESIFYFYYFINDFYANDEKSPNTLNPFFISTDWISDY